jgi:hypothetical protein
MRLPRLGRAVVRMGGALLLAGMLMGIGSPARGTVREWLMLQAGLDPAALHSAPSVRLSGMGLVDLCVPDEANETNIRDFGLNVAGVLDDSDGWVIESWYGGNRQQANRPAQDNKHSFGSAGGQVVYRSAQMALGLDYNWTFYETTQSPGDWARVRGPLASVLINRRFGRFVLGGVAGSEHENESRSSDDYFSVRHDQSRWVGQLGGQAAMGGAIFAAGWDFERGDVEGKSVDPARFHEDELMWTRPVDRFSLAVVVPATGTFEAGLRARFMDRTGGETEIVSWSDTSPYNPSKEFFRREGLITFREEESDADVAGRVRFALGQLTGTAEAVYRSWEWSAVEGTNFKGSNRAGRQASDVLKATGGVCTQFLRGRLLAAVQGEMGQADWERTQERVPSEGTARYGTLGAGLELFVTHDVALRGGMWFTSQDGDVNAPLTLSRGTGMSGGISWLPNGGTVQIHGSFRHISTNPQEDRATNVDEKAESGFLMGLRLLF